LTAAEFRAWHGCLQFTNTVMRELDSALIAAHGISVKEFDVLITLFNAPAGRLRMTELSERVVLTPSGVTHLVTRLERDRLGSRRQAHLRVGAWRRGDLVDRRRPLRSA